MRYPVVLFDVGETMVGPSRSFGSVYAAVVERLGLELSAERAERSLRQVWGEMERTIPLGTDRYAHFPGGEDEYWLRFARRTLELASGGAIDDPLARDAVERIRAAFADRAAWKVYPDVRPTLETLRRDGVRLGVVSNWDSRLPRVLQMLELADFFEAVGVSHLEGVEKPDARLFHRVLERMGARPEQSLHVGDLPEIDLAGARAAGLAGVLVDRRGKWDGRWPTLRDLTPLPAVVRGEVELG